ncbi:MAG: hypothetical protein RLZZ618_1940 [Pseudomonadota bacterium]|jgi:poly(hydroxyalkanoate) depolymerase family esterase
MRKPQPLFAKWVSQSIQWNLTGASYDAAAAIKEALKVLQPQGSPAAATAPPPGLDELMREAKAKRESALEKATGQVSAGEFSTRTHTGLTGRRAYKLYVPPNANNSTPLPLVLMLHGCKQDPDDFAAGTRMNELASELGFLVLYPAQPPRSNQAKCWNWFQPSDQRRGNGECAFLADLTRHVIATQGVDPEQVYVAGLSAGGAMTAILGREYPDIFAAIGVHSGLPRGAAHDIPSAFAAMRGSAPLSPARAKAAPYNFHVPAIVFHGDADATVHASNGDELIADATSAWPQINLVHTTKGEQGGRQFTMTAYDDSHGLTQAEHWVLHGAGHAWSGGSADGSYTDADGPDASREMLRFFLEHRRLILTNSHA